eukprot:scaffold11052_cov51-Isochrysis_galbana.AAC.1
MMLLSGLTIQAPSAFTEIPISPTQIWFGASGSGRIRIWHHPHFAPRVLVPSQRVSYLGVIHSIRQQYANVRTDKVVGERA